MDLELKHLAPYLPYGLKISNPKGGQPLVLSVYERNGFSISDILTKDYYKPLLFPISELNGGDKITEVAKWLCYQEPESFDSIDNAIGWLCYQSMQQTLNIPYKVIDKFFEMHIDVFGLIEQGLAIDINTI